MWGYFKEFQIARRNLRPHASTTLSQLSLLMRDSSNMIVDRNSSRVLAPPGGHSTIFSAMSEQPLSAPVAVQRVDAPFATHGLPTERATEAAFPEQRVAGARVEVRNEYTGISQRPSTLVHAPPGGRQSINIFGAGTDYPVDKPAAPKQAVAASPARRNITDYTTTDPSSPYYGAAGGRVQERNGVRTAMNNGIPPSGMPSSRLPPGGIQSPARMCGNPIAGARVENRSELHGVRSSTTVRAPPGGHSSFSFGGDEPKMAEFAAQSDAKGRRAALMAARAAACENMTGNRPF